MALYTVKSEHGYFFQTLERISNSVSKITSPLLLFCIATLCDWLKYLAPLSQAIRSETKTTHAFSRASRRGDVFGSLHRLPLLWLATVNTFPWVLLHSSENHSHAEGI